MDCGIFKKREKNPKEEANVFSLITFYYINKIFKIGNQKDVTEDNLFYIYKKFQSKKLGDKLEEIANDLQQKYKYVSTARLAIRFCAKKYLYMGLMQLVVRTFLVIYTPWTLGQFVNYFTPNQKELTAEEASFYGLFYIGLLGIQYIYEQNYELMKAELKIEMQAALCSLVYRKALKLSTKALTQISVGKIVSLISKDINAFEIIIYANDLCVEIFQIGIVIYLFYVRVGVSTFFGFGILLFTLPIQVFIANIIKNKRTISNQKSDERLQLTQEILAAIRIIKMYTWEKFFEDKLTESRKIEMKKLRLILMVKDISLMIGKLCSTLSFYLLISSYVWMGNTLTAQLVFYLYSSFDRLENTIIYLMPLCISQIGEVIASFKRFDKLLNSSETLQYEGEYILTKDPVVILRDVNVEISNSVLLKNVSAEFKPGLNIIYGPVGSGKSNLVKTILNEYKSSNGKIKVEGKISYSSQSPWLFPSTLKQNILFGQKYIQSKYQHVLYICALDFDLKNLEQGDQTIIGDCGVTLSKGQQARVNLARAIYRDSDIYLLDDCFSALDPHVRAHIFKKCVQEHLKIKVCILVTHDQHFLQQADNIVVVNDGTVTYNGNLTNLPEKLMENNNALSSNKNTNQVEKQAAITSNEEGALLEFDDGNKENIYHEDNNSGKVSWSIYRKYINMGGGFFFFSIVVILLATGGSLMTFGKEVLSDWVDIDEHINALTEQKNASTSELKTLVDSSSEAFISYTTITLVGSLLYLISLLLHYTFCAKISINLHNKMAKAMLGASIKFFDTHLIGNVLNRFSKDLYYVDEELVYTVHDFLMVLVIVVSTAALISSVNVVFCVASIIFAIFFIFLGKTFLPVGRNLKRLNSSTRSPVVGYLNASLEGLMTVRAWRNGPILQDEFDYHQDLYTSANHTLITFQLGFSLILKLTSWLFTAIIVGKFLYIGQDAAGSVGISLTQVTMLTYCLEYCIKSFVDLESHMTCLERAIDYAEVEQEKSPETILENWPNKSSITFKNVLLTYTSKENPVLKNLNFEIKPNEKVAIVGRTGAGKSSIISVIFRMYDIEGEILIDSVDIKTLPLNQLRNGITIIPQDPILFTGTMRSNLDPYEKFTDAEIWKALQKVNLNKSIVDLSEMVHDCGANLSIGEKQLICIARAIINKNKILVLDEATANMDEKMDELIHKTIEKCFKDCTVISISHRLKQVLNYDKVMVMEKGKLIEFDKPAQLLLNENGEFYKMAYESNLI